MNLRDRSADIYEKDEDGKGWSMTRRDVCVYLYHNGAGRFNGPYQAKNPKDAPMLQITVETYNRKTLEWEQVEGLYGPITHHHMTEDDEDMYDACWLFMGILYDTLMSERREAFAQVREIALDTHPLDAVTPYLTFERVERLRAGRSEAAALSDIGEDRWQSMGQPSHRRPLPTLWFVDTLAGGAGTVAEPEALPIPEPDAMPIDKAAARTALKGAGRRIAAILAAGAQPVFSSGSQSLRIVQ